MLYRLIDALHLPDPIEDLRCVKTLAKDGMRMSIYERALPCGHLELVVQLEIWDEDAEKWLYIGLFWQEHVASAMFMLTQAQKFIDGVRANDYELVAD